MTNKYHSLHPLLKRQLRRRGLDQDIPDIAFQEFVKNVNQSYFEFDNYRELIERAMSISSEELVSSRDKAQEALKIKSRFLANMSHEIRTPMNGVLGMTELLLETDLNTEQKELAQTVYHSASHLLTIINDILDFSKIEAGKIDLIHSPFRLRETLARWKQIFLAKLQEKKIEYIIEITPATPDWIVGDSGRLLQVLTNLVGNAIKFTPPDGGIMIYVETVAQSDTAATIRFHIADSGIGIAPCDQKNIFVAFQQASRSDMKRYGGTGLGLAISADLVRLMHGELTLTSIPDRGSRFSFNAVFEVPQQVPETVAEQVESRQPAFGKVTPVRILVAEDNQINQLLIEKILKRDNHQVTIVSDGLEAVKAVKDGLFDIILMDIQMPQLDGIAATAAIRALAPAERSQIPVIALTGNALVGDKERFLAAGMNDYLSKPYAANSIRKLIAKWSHPEILGLKRVLTDQK